MVARDCKPRHPPDGTVCADRRSRDPLWPAAAWPAEEALRCRAGLPGGGAGAAGCPQRASLAADDAAIPSQDGAGGDDEPHRGEALDRQRPGQRGQPCTVRPRQPRMSPRSFAQGDRELMAQHQDLGVLPPRLPARQPEQQHHPGDDQGDQLYAHKPKIIASPAGPTPVDPAPDAGPSQQRAMGHMPRWHRFRHAQVLSAPPGAVRAQPAQSRHKS